MNKLKMKNIAPIAVLFCAIMLVLTLGMPKQDVAENPSASVSDGDESRNEPVEAVTPSIAEKPHGSQENSTQTVTDTDGEPTKQDGQSQQVSLDIISNNGDKTTASLTVTIPKQDENSNPATSEGSKTSSDGTGTEVVGKTDEETAGGKTDDEDPEGGKGSEASEQNPTDTGGESDENPNGPIVVGKVEKLKAKKNGTKITATWDAVENAYGYQVYTRTVNGDVQLRQNVTDNKVCLSNLTPGTTYIIKVRAYTYDENTSEWVYGEFSKEVTITLDKPSDNDTSGEDDNHGRGDDNKPGGDDNKPGGDDNKPGGDDNKPGGDDNKPGGDDNKPGGDDNKPGGDDNKPGDDDKPPEKITITGLVFEQTETYTYDGITEYRLEVTGLPEGVIPVYTLKDIDVVGKGEENWRINAGWQEIEVSFIIDEEKYNPVAPMTAILTVDKANPPKVIFEDKTFAYFSGSFAPEYGIYVETEEGVDLPEGVIFTGYELVSIDGVTPDLDDQALPEDYTVWSDEKGDYVIRANFELDETLYDPSNYKSSVEALLKIDYGMKVSLEQRDFWQDDDGNQQIEVVLKIDNLMDGLWINGLNGTLLWNDEILEPTEFRSHGVWCDEWLDEWTDEDLQDELLHWANLGGLLLHTNSLDFDGTDIETRSSGDILSIIFTVKAEDLSDVNGTNIIFTTIDANGGDTIIEGYTEPGEDGDFSDEYWEMMSAAANLEVEDNVQITITIQQTSTDEDTETDNSQEDKDAIIPEQVGQVEPVTQEGNSFVETLKGEEELKLELDVLPEGEVQAQADSEGEAKPKDENDGKDVAKPEGKSSDVSEGGDGESEE